MQPGLNCSARGEQLTMDTMRSRVSAKTSTTAEPEMPLRSSTLMCLKPSRSPASFWQRLL